MSDYRNSGTRTELRMHQGSSLQEIVTTTPLQHLRVTDVTYRDEDGPLFDDMLGTPKAMLGTPTWVVFAVGDLSKAMQEAEALAKGVGVKVRFEAITIHP